MILYASQWPGFEFINFQMQQNTAMYIAVSLIKVFEDEGMYIYI